MCACFGKNIRKIGHTNKLNRVDPVNQCRVEKIWKWILQGHYTPLNTHDGICSSLFTGVLRVGQTDRSSRTGGGFTAKLSLGVHPAYNLKLSAREFGHLEPGTGVTFSTVDTRVVGKSVTHSQHDGIHREGQQKNDGGQQVIPVYQPGKQPYRHQQQRDQGNNSQNQNQVGRNLKPTGAVKNTAQHLGNSPCCAKSHCTQRQDGEDGNKDP